MTRLQLMVETGTKAVKLVTVRWFGEKLQLCCVDRQKQGTLVEISEKPENSNILAFCFSYEESSYSLMADGNNLKLEQGTHTDRDSVWFERVSEGSGEPYRLRSVAEPHLYVCASRNPEGSRRIVLGLSDDEAESVLVTEESV